ncbi:MAG: CAP domain-containing protein, partial [Lachnospiraceae bacterium]|nr:CAP domain-containing protein [Lachnospiraceae bacterium]
TSDAAHSYARQVVELVNEERAKAGLPALVMDGVLTRAANVRAKEIKKSFSHTRPDGTGFSSVLKEYGISYRGSGENIAWGQKSPEEVVEGWMNSEGHRANIMNKNFKNIGVGYYQDERGVNYWVQLFTY